MLRLGFPAGTVTFHSSEKVALLQSQVARQRPRRDDTAVSGCCQSQDEVEVW